MQPGRCSRPGRGPLPGRAPRPSSAPPRWPPAEAVRTAAEELADLNERETGKTRDDALGGVNAGADTLMQYAELGPLHRGHSLQGSWAATDLMIPEPRGVVAVLTPWNDAVAVAAGLLGAALVTENTVVHKPSERCPATGRRFAELLGATLPEGVRRSSTAMRQSVPDLPRQKTSTSWLTWAAVSPAGR